MYINLDEWIVVFAVIGVQLVGQVNGYILALFVAGFYECDDFLVLKFPDSVTALDEGNSGA